MLYYISRLVFIILLRILFRVRFFGRENFPKPPFIIASNHASLADPPLVGAACWKYPVVFMAKQELFNIPIIGMWSKNVNCIEVKRGENSVRSLKEAVKRLKNGSVVGIFPEGTRSLDGKLQDAKRGMGFLLAKANVPVVPIHIKGSGKAWAKGQGIKFGTDISVVIGKPISPDVFCPKDPSEKTDYESLASMVMDHVAQLSKEKGS